jgi:hypothetical protein
LNSKTAKTLSRLPSLRIGLIMIAGDAVIGRSLGCQPSRRALLGIRWAVRLP